MDHDQNFKNLILDYPLQALELFAAPEAQSLLARQNIKITPIRQEQLKHRLKDRFRATDVPLLVDWPDGQKEAIVFALEEESQSSRFSIHRLAHYCLDLAELYNTQRIVPVVIFLGSHSRQQQLNLGGEKYEYLKFWYLFCSLGEMSWQDHQHSNNLVARLNLPNMQYDKKHKIDVYAHALKGLISLEADLNKRAKYVDFIDIYTDLSNNEMQNFKVKYPEEVKNMSNFASRFEQRGVEKGMKKGMQQGMQQGEAMVLLRQIEMKFGKPSKHTQDKVENADCDTLLLWSGRILTASSLDTIWS